MAMLGSLVTSDMEPNHIYGGSPARDLTEKLGGQFEERSVDFKVSMAWKMIKDFEEKYPNHTGRIMAVETMPASELNDVTYLDLSNRTYTRRLSCAEALFFKENVPLIKLLPKGESLLFEPSCEI